MCAAAAVIPIERHLTKAAVQFAPGLLEELRDRVLDGYAAAPHGGIEVGFVALGYRQSSALVIAHIREIPCAHLLGPRFALSPDEEKGFPAWLEGLRAEPELQGLVPLGWGCSHNRSEVVLLDREIAFHQRFFPRLQDIVMIAKPQSMQAASIGIFLPEANGLLNASSPTQVMRSAMLDSLWDSHPPIEENKKMENRNIPARPDNTQPQSPKLSAAHVTSRKPRSAFFRWISVGVSLAVLAALLCFGLTKRFGLPVWFSPAPPSLSVAIHRQANDLVFTWQASVPQVKSATIEVLDGTAVSHYNVSSSFSSSGILVFPHKTGNVQAKLIVQTPNGKLMRSAGFIDSRLNEQQPDAYGMASDSAASRLDTANRRLAALVSVLQSREEHRKK